MAQPTTDQVLDVFEAILTGLYPQRRVYRRKKPPDNARDRLSGLTVADLSGNGVFVLYAGDPDPNDRVFDSENVHFVTPVEVAYAKIVTSVERDEDPEIRATRTAVNDAFNTPRLPGLGDARVVGFDQGPPYHEISGDQRALLSVQTVSVHTKRPRT